VKIQLQILCCYEQEPQLEESSLSLREDKDSPVARKNLNIQISGSAKGCRGTPSASAGDEHILTLMIMHNIASTYYGQSRWEEAEELVLRETTSSKRLLGDEHPLTPGGMHNLASTYRDQDRLKEVEELGIKMLDMRKKTLREEHPYTLNSMTSLAWTLKLYGRDSDALELLKESLRLSIVISGESHHDTLERSETVKRWSPR
jgi:hypothetical protein